MIAAATSAIPSGSSRAGGPKISARVNVITIRAATSRITIASVSSSESPSTTTGAPLTTYAAPRSWNAGSPTASRIRSIASLRSDVLRSGFSRTRICAASVARPEDREARLRLPGVGRIEDHGADEGRVVEPWQAALAVVDRELDELLPEARQDLVGRGLGRGLLLRVVEPLPARVQRGGDRRGPSLALRGPRLVAQDVRRLDRRLVEERRTPEHRLRGLLVGDSRARLGGRLVGEHPAALDVARQAALQREQLPEVGGQDEPVEVALDEHDDRVVAEPLLEVLGRAVGGRVVVDELVGAGVRLEPQRGHRPDHGDAARRRRPPGSAARRTSPRSVRSDPSRSEC